MSSDEWQKHAEASDKELVALEDALIGNHDKCDASGKIIDRQERLKERICDLIAAEGEAGDAKQRIATLEEALKVAKESLEEFKGQWGSNWSKVALERIEQIETGKDRAALNK